MSETERTEFTGCRPVLPVADMAASVAHYRDILGFTVEWGWPDAPPGTPEGEARHTFVSIFRSGFQLFLREREGSVQPVEIVVGMPDEPAVDAVAAEYVRTGARIHEPPSGRPWGTYEMEVRDLDGHRLRLLTSRAHG